MTDIIDQIDALVDGQLQQERSGYDHNINQVRCPNCGRAWHGLPLTQRVASMYAIGQFNPEYVAAHDDSPIVCQGSTVYDPNAKKGVSDIGDAYVIILPDFGLITEQLMRMREQFAQFATEAVDAFADLGRRFNEATTSLNDILGPRPKRPPQCLWSGIRITFGQHNWHHEMFRLRPEFQFPRVFHYPHYRFLNPLERDVHRLWPHFTAPDFPIPPSPGYDFTAWATDIQHGPQRRDRRDQRADTRRAATAARRNGRRARG